MSASLIVSPANIQKELNALWDSLENKNKMRASLFNIIFYTKKTPRDEYIRKIAHKIIEKFPARIFFISSDTDPTQDYMKTAVSVISEEQGEYDITCDFIELSVAGKAENQVPFIILPHIIPDLPIFLVWAEDPTLDNPLLVELQKFATRLIFDSETTENLSRFAKAILKMKQLSNCEIADLNWARLETWRDFLSASFYSREQLEKLRKVTSLHITHNARETPFFCHTKIQSIYLQAWLASRLNWTLHEVSSSKEGVKFSYLKDNTPIQVSIDSVRQTELAPGMIYSIDITTTDKESFHFIKNLQLPNQISYQYSNSVECLLPTEFLFAKGESGQSLVKEICHKGTSQHYLEIVTLIAKMDKLSLC